MDVRAGGSLDGVRGRGVRAILRGDGVGVRAEGVFLGGGAGGVGFGVEFGEGFVAY